MVLVIFLPICKRAAIVIPRLLRRIRRIEAFENARKKMQRIWTVLFFMTAIIGTLLILMIYCNSLVKFLVAFVHVVVD